jgi:hypothetical protein
VDPQLIWLLLAGLELEVTVPPPRRRLDFLTLSVNICTAKVAVTVLAARMVTVQVVPDTVSHPLQPARADPATGAAVSVTTVPVSYDAEQVAPQSIWEAPAGLEVEVTAPLPVPAFARVKIAVTAKLAALVAVPPGVVTLRGPVVAPTGTTA